MRTSGRRQSDKQVTAYVGVTERPLFEAYAQQFGLDAGNLLHILWQRELRLKRLERLDERHLEPAEAGLDSKVTAHLADPALKPLIKKRAEAVDLFVSRASAMLLREEMAARWLEKVLDLTDSN